MKNLLRSLFVAASFALLGAVASASVVGQAAPALTFKDLAGKDVSLAALKGKVVVVDFWATWCGPCRMEIPGYIEMQKKYGKDGVVIVGVSLDQKGPKHVQKFVEQNALNYTVVMGDNTAVEAFGGFNSIPTTFLIGRDGKILHEKSGAMDHEQYEAILKKAL
ncbi:TlpA family protein disulfide reductase [Oleiharenicola lentus]|jgi:thiol-disulfide isomerase/thioredoxin|uniref:TlpA family protein disulfide reductase n=1 Tax=Oleiharenicola lentus TaxID=2508720 RepID=A0A4Q1C5S8_9BACT|nr:TlpA disulfide reductase family protein [Oleiharenicola lentus]RXK53788.1 TlpA family protein disulfide reductase [Oleiharenicola lentus]